MSFYVDALAVGSDNDNYDNVGGGGGGKFVPMMVVLVDISEVVTALVGPYIENDGTE